MHYEIELLSNLDTSEYHESEKLTVKSSSQLLAWNQTFTLKIESGLEKIVLRLYLYSVVLGRLLLDALELDVDKYLPMLMD